MKALSIRQPWAWAILFACKDVENRDWKVDGPNMREARRLQNSDILLHAGKGMTRAEYEDCLSICHAISRRHPFPSGLTLPAFHDLPRGGIVGRARFAGVINESVSAYATRADLQPALNSPWFFGPWGLVLANTKPTKFIPFKGALGFFDIPDEIVREAMAA